MADRVRVLRILEYVGDREWVEDTLKRSIQGTKEIPVRGGGIPNIIKSATIDYFPEKVVIENKGV